MLRRNLLTAALVATLLGPAWSHAALQSSPPINVDGGMPVRTNGITLYTFDKDAPGKSACNGPCADNWPPVKAGATNPGQGDYGIVTRDDGSKQWAYKGKPLYFWAMDAKPGATSRPLDSLSWSMRSEYGHHRPRF